MLFKNDKAISPVVATLVLIVVAIIGAAAVGVILGAFGSDVSSQASADNSKNTASQEITVAGSTTVQPVSELLAKGFMEKNPGVKISVSGGGSGAGIAGAGLGSIDVGSASKYLGDADKQKFPNLEEHVIGGSAVVVLANAAVTATHASRAELLAIYDRPVADGGTAAAQLGGAAYPANLKAYQRTEASGTEETFARFINTDPKATDVDNQADTDGTIVRATAIGNQGVVDGIKSSGTVPAIGFVDYGFAKSAISPTGLHILAIDGITATTVDDTNVKAAIKELMSGKESTAYYPNNKDTGLCRPLVYLTNGAPSAVVSSYINFAASPAALDYFHQAGYWGITEL